MTTTAAMSQPPIRRAPAFVALCCVLLLVSASVGCGGSGPDNASPEKIVRSYLAMTVATSKANFDRELHERAGMLRIQNAYAQWRAEYDREAYENVAHGLEAERVGKGELFKFDANEDIKITNVVVFTTSTKKESVTRASVSATITRRELVEKDGAQTTVVHTVVKDVVAECREEAGRWYLTKIDIGG